MADNAPDGSYYIETYHGRKIYTLPHYTTPYYWSPALTYAERRTLGSSNHTGSYATLSRRIDRAITQKELDHVDR